MGRGSTEPGGPEAGLAAVRIRLDIGYDGTGFSGWARQPGRRTGRRPWKTRSRAC